MWHRWWSVALAVLIGAMVVVSGVRHAPLQVTWEGGTDYEMVEKARGDFATARAQAVRLVQVRLASPGGPVIPALMLVREVLEARKSGMIVAIHGHSIVASAGIWVLGSGTPGQRTIAKRTLTLVHGLQVRGGFFSPPECVDESNLEKQDTETQQTIKALLAIIYDMEAELTGKTIDTVRTWSQCGEERAGDGSLLVELGLADRVEG